MTFKELFFHEARALEIFWFNKKYLNCKFVGFDSRSHIHGYVVPLFLVARKQKPALTESLVKKGSP